MDTLEGIIEDIKEVIGPEEDDKDFGEEESEVESQEEYVSEDQAPGNGSCRLFFSFYLSFGPFINSYNRCPWN
ncbi:MAG: hypothetical protein HYX67_12415 [Candidatus Melainabacteria bacterium]|nr:hypothetical protein [Candidatus Melainabacteria bacterium]